MKIPTSQLHARITDILALYEHQREEIRLESGKMLLELARKDKDVAVLAYLAMPALHDDDGSTGHS